MNAITDLMDPRWLPAVLAGINAVALLAWLGARWRLVLGARRRVALGRAEATDPQAVIAAYLEETDVAAARSAETVRDSATVTRARTVAADGDTPRGRYEFAATIDTGRTAADETLREAERRLADDIARFRARVQARAAAPAPVAREATR